MEIFRLLCDDGNCGRYEVNVKNIRLTDLKIKISWGARPGTVKKVSKLPQYRKYTYLVHYYYTLYSARVSIQAWAAANMTEAYAGTDLAKAAATKARRANLTDFERYKVCT